MLREKDNIINVLVLNGPLVFFSFSALLGLRYSREDGAGLGYKAYMIFLLLLGVSVYARNLINRRTFFLQELFPLVCLFIYIISGLLEGFSDDPVYLQMVCFSLPATCIALNMNGDKELAGVMRWLDAMLPLFSLSFLFMVVNIYLSRQEGTGWYDQNASYMIAFCFLIDIYLLRYSDMFDEFPFLNKKWYKVFKFLLLPYFVVMAFFAGGRGAFITILVGLLFNADLLKKFNPRLLYKILAISTVILVLVGYSLAKLDSDYWDLLTNNFDRIFQLVNADVDASTATSGRDEIYQEAFGLFCESPVYGYGLFSYMKLIMHPHNIVLEILLQGGLILLTVFCIIFLQALGKFRKIKRIDDSQILLTPFVIYPFTQLLFSASYTFVPLFWFSLSYVYNYRFDRVPVEYSR